MHLRFKVCIHLLLFLGAITTVNPALAQQSSTLEEIKFKLRELRVQLSGKQSERGRVLIELEKSNSAITRLQKNIDQITEDRMQINANITTLESRQLNLFQEKHLQQQSLVQQLIAAYKTGRQSKIKMLLSQKNPENIGRLLSYHNYLNIAREEQIIALQNTIESLKDLAEDIKKQTWQLSVNEEQLNREKKILASEKAKKSQLLTMINADISSKSKKITQLGKDQARLEKLIADLAKRKAQQANASPSASAALNTLGFSKNKGLLGWPIQGRIIHGFNSIIAGDIRRAGIFIASAEGIPVKAIYQGTVIYADWFQTKGLMIIINHGNGYMSLYAHNQSLLNKEGDKIRTGEKIAISGQSGSIVTPGLYFEIRQNGKALNPSQWLRP